MKKTSLLCVLTLILGVLAGITINFTVFQGVGLLTPAEPLVTIPALPLETPAPDLSGGTALLEAGGRVLEALKDRDYTALSKLVHPQAGVTLTPYSTVDFNADLTLTADQVAQAGMDKNKYTWGTGHGSGAPIQMTIPQYLSDFVFNEDYTAAPLIGVDKVLSSGNSLENVAEAYPDDRFVEYYFPGVDPQYEGIDWSALKLVFREDQGALWLVGLIHSQWTI